MRMPRRRKYLVNKPVQFKYIALITIPLALLLSGLYYLIYYSVFRQMLIPEAVVVTLLPAMRNVNIITAFSLPVLLYLILKLALIYSNRIIGPLPRLQKEIDRVLAGDYSLRMKIRSKDELKTFINKINLLLDKLEKANRI